jgi:hypothetical protein
MFQEERLQFSEMLPSIGLIPQHEVVAMGMPFINMEVSFDACGAKLPMCPNGITEH